MTTDQNAQFEMLDLLRGVDADAESLFSLLDHSGGMEGEAIQKAVYQLRLSLAQALGDRERAQVAQESLAELGGGAEPAEAAPTRLPPHRTDSSRSGVVRVVETLTLDMHHQSGGFHTQDSMVRWIAGCLNCNTNHVQVDVRAPTASEAANVVRNAGGAAVVFSENELNGVDADSVEGRLVELGNEVIEVLAHEHRPRVELGG